MEFSEVLFMFAVSFLLGFIHFSVNIAGFQQFIMRSARCDFAIVHNNDQVGVLHRADALSNDELGGVREEGRKGFLDGSNGLQGATSGIKKQVV
jgi:hypothetical protein